MTVAAKPIDASVPPARCLGCTRVGTLVPILYGFHSADSEARARRGQAVLGVFSAGPNAPRWECLTCGARMR